MKTTCLTFVLLLICLSGFGQTARFEWIRAIGDSGDDCAGQVANDSFGNFYVSGVFVGQLVFGADTLRSTSVSSASIFLAKYDSTGAVLWAKKLPVTNPNTIGTCGSVTLSKLRISPNGRIYLLGSLSSREYLAIYRNDGSLVGYADQSLGNRNMDIDFDSVDNAYLVGNTPGAGGDNAFIIKFDSSGNTKWSYVFNQESMAMNVKYVRGVVYITGQFHYQLNLADTVGSAPITLSATQGINDWDLFSVAYSKDGALLFASKHNGPLSGAAGPFKITGDISAVNDWRIALLDAGMNAYTCSYSLTSLLPLSSSVYATISSCSITGIASVKADRFGSQAIVSYSELLLCPGTTAHVLAANSGVTETITVPYAGPPNVLPRRDFAFNRNKSLFICGQYQGTITYQDTAGAHSLSSQSGSQDMYIGKYHRCPRYQPLIEQKHDSLVCTVAGLSYQWFRNNTLITSDTLGFIIPSQSGNIKVVVRDNWGCTDTSFMFPFEYIPTTGINGTELYAAISVQPIPAKTTITISGLQLGEPYQIIDLTGRIVAAGVARSSRDAVSISELSSGVYVLRTSRNFTKVIKE
jgi:hypothetical protein